MLRLNTGDPGFQVAFQRLVRDRRESDDDVSRDVARIISEVRNRGDAALAEFTQLYDGHSLNGEDSWSISREACREAYEDLLPDLRAALELAAQRIRAFHEVAKAEESRHNRRGRSAHGRALAAGR